MGPMGPMGTQTLCYPGPHHSPVYAKIKVVVKWRDNKYIYIQSLVEIMLYDVIVSIFRAYRSFRPIQMGRKQPCVQCLPHLVNRISLILLSCQYGERFQVRTKLPVGSRGVSNPWRSVWKCRGRDGQTQILQCNLHHVERMC